LFARVLKFYQLDYDHLLSYKWKRFLFLNKQIDRLQAEEDLRLVQLFSAAGSQEGYTALTERLQRQMGNVAVYEQTITVLNMDDNSLDPEFDREGLHALMGRRPPQDNK